MTHATHDSGQAGVRDDLTREVADYLDAVREALADLPASERDDLLEDLSAHLTEVAAEDPAPLQQRLGPPAAYAAELRAASAPAARGVPGPHRLAAWWERSRGRLRRLDAGAGPLLGYERASEFGRLLVPAWWVLRGYLAAMLVVSILDQDSSLGLLPRLGGTTLVGLVVLAAFIAGSVWLARRTPGLARWQRRAIHVASGVVAVFGLAAFVDVDFDRQYGSGTVTYVSGNPYENVQDVFAIDQNGQLLTGVMLLDQDGRPLEIGWARCDEVDQIEQFGRPVVTYPRCPDGAPPWLATRQTPLATPSPTQPPTTPSPQPVPSAVPSAVPSPVPSAVPSPSLSPPPTPSTTPR